MLYRLIQQNQNIENMEPIAFHDFSSIGKYEKDLENLIAENLLDMLYEDNRLMAIYQERSLQPEADVYALNENGELYIFELKRSTAYEDAVNQVLRYAQIAGQWDYSKLESMFQEYQSVPEQSLAHEHERAFDLPEPLLPHQFNRKQHLVVIGSAADVGLMNAVDYWRKQGIQINFLPYRIYELNQELYFEFFALPYDFHSNPKDIKGILFDTCKSWDEAIWIMMEQRRVAAWGNAKRFVNYINENDIIFFSHSGAGLVAAATVNKGKVRESDDDGLYRDVEFITSIPVRGSEIRAMPFWKVREIMGKNFFWASTIKTPYLSSKETEKLTRELKAYLQ